MEMQIDHQLVSIGCRLRMQIVIFFHLFCSTTSIDFIRKRVLWSFIRNHPPYFYDRRVFLHFSLDILQNQVNLFSLAFPSSIKNGRRQAVVHFHLSLFRDQLHFE